MIGLNGKLQNIVKDGMYKSEGGPVDTESPVPEIEKPMPVLQVEGEVLSKFGFDFFYRALTEAIENQKEPEYAAFFKMMDNPPASDPLEKYFEPKVNIEFQDVPVEDNDYFIEETNEYLEPAFTPVVHKSIELDKIGRFVSDEQIILKNDEEE